uniref:helix-turn-helix domain-containing protein n=1 Tax=Paraburkholderia elongata TaxID=2675747 RepID=UPI001F292492|nr:helix-turn-helix domain-containing protein [Paraburkholderia elongata]
MGKIYAHLSAEERGVIFAMKLENCSSGEIALALQRSHSTISRELRRNNWKPKHKRSALGRPPIAQVIMTSWQDRLDRGWQSPGMSEHL